MSSPLAVIILAAGKGKRMGNADVPKVMVPLVGIPLIGHVLREVALIEPIKIVTIVGHHKEQVIDYVSQRYPHVEFATQEQQLGTGHAVQQTEHVLRDFDGDILILCGDTPLIKAATLKNFCDDHIHSGVSVSVLSCIMDNPTGYGRIIRDDQGQFTQIVEERDATDEQRAVTEINSGVYAVKSQVLYDALQRIHNSNSQGEYYLTDIISILGADGHAMAAYVSPTALELMGVNRPEELVMAEQILSFIKGEEVQS